MADTATVATSTPGASVAPASPSGETFWDFVNTTSQYDVKTFASKYQTPLILAGLGLVAAFFLVEKVAKR